MASRFVVPSTVVLFLALATACSGTDGLSANDGNQLASTQDPVCVDTGPVC